MNGETRNRTSAFGEELGYGGCAQGSYFDPLEDEELRLKASGDSRRALREAHGPLLEEMSQSALFY